MKQNSVKVIGIKDESRKVAYLSNLKKEDGLKFILSSDFDDWSNFDSWDSISAQQWIFCRALDVYKGKKIDIRCDCCDYIDSLPSNFENIKKEKCYGKKSAYMIAKVLDEIVFAKARRESDGTYSA